MKPQCVQEGHQTDWQRSESEDLGAEGGARPYYCNSIEQKAESRMDEGTGAISEIPAAM
jgi:hypothetical protein